MVLLLCIAVLLVIYSALIFYYWISWKSIPEYIPQATAHLPKISVIIAARNEETNIATLLTALDNQVMDRDLFEVIVVDDYSTDNTANIIKSFPLVKLIQNQTLENNSYKKKAIETGISQAQNPWIVVTDADCLPDEKWLITIASFIAAKNPEFIAAPVEFIDGNNLLAHFQVLDFMILQGITGASVHKKIHSMCNGANLAYTKKAFSEVDGFSGINQIASGDDMLLMHKIWQLYPDKIFYLKSKSAIMLTKPMPTLKTFLNQRIRWASKAMHYNDNRILPVLVLVYFFNLSFFALICAAFFQPAYWIWVLIFIAAKTLIELPFIYSLSQFFDKKPMLKYFIFIQPLHIFYTIVSGLFGQFGKYEWKGRRVK